VRITASYVKINEKAMRRTRTVKAVTAFREQKRLIGFRSGFIGYSRAEKSLKAAAPE